MKKQHEVSGTIYEIGKLPPQAVDVEEAVLGAMMLEEECCDIVIPLLPPAAFYKEAHQLIYESIMVLHRENKKVDILTVTQNLMTRGKIDQVGGAYYITGLSNRIASSANTHFHAAILRDKFIYREIIRTSTLAISQAYSDDGSEALKTIQEGLDGIERIFSLEKREFDFSDVVTQAVSDAIQRKEDVNSGKQLGIDTGLHDLNKETGGWQDGHLIIIAARPSMGKTAIALTFAKRSAETDNPVGIFSLETKNVKLVDRMLIAKSGVDAYRYRRGRMTDAEQTQIIEAADLIRSLPIYIDDTATTTVSRIKSKCRLLKKQGKLRLVIIDYLQLVGSDIENNRNQNREQEVAKITRGLKVMAMELNIPVILLCQLSREPEKRADKRPQLSDLRESGSIEQDADIVIFPFRPHYYGLSDDEGNSEEGICHLIIAKNREEERNEIKVRHNSNLTHFYDYDADPNQTEMPF